MAKTQGDQKVVRIGGATASFSDTALSVPQLLADDALDYLVFDYLAEGSMGIFGRMQAADPALGFGTDFLTVHVGPYLREIASQGIKVVANAGGVNPAGLATALEELIAESGLHLTVAYVAGDDLRGREAELRSAGCRDMFTGADFPDDVLSSNAYFGAFPIAAALAQGADIVITGRVVDSAAVLGPLIHEFGWGAEDWDLLAAGTLAGHVLECGAQVTGGTFTDWHDVPDWANIGYPIGECSADGTFIIMKPEGTGGLVSIGTVAEQILYEVSDPVDYIVADVCCDFSNVTLEQLAPNRVRVSGAKGFPATTSYKACITFDEGWRAIAYQPIIGEDAAEKAVRQAEALFSRSRALLQKRNLPDFISTESVLIGGEASFGAHAIPGGSREVISKLVVDHSCQEGAQIFAREQWAGISGMSVGTSINLATTLLPKTGIFLFLIDKQEIVPTMTINGVRQELPAYHRSPVKDERPASKRLSPEPLSIGERTANLVDLAWARSGDKGHLFNVAVIARKPEYLPYLQLCLTPEAVGEWYRHFGTDGKPPRVDCYEAPGLHALNFVVHDALQGGINASTRLDPAAKGMAQMLLRFPIRIPDELWSQLSIPPNA